MSRLLIEGGKRLDGRVCLQGAKNSVLPILAATLLYSGTTVLENCPRLRDVAVSVQILRHLGCRVDWTDDRMTVTADGLQCCDISDILMRETRSSAIFLGAILARLGKADLSFPGGCPIGPRPIDLHIAGLRDLGAEITEDGGNLHCTAARLRGNHILLSLPSVGATENLMLAACGAEGVTTIENAAREPEIVDLQKFLQSMGAEVSGAGSSTVTIVGKRPLHDTVFSVMPDRIAAATYLCAGASAGGTVRIDGAREQDLATVTGALREAGCKVCSDAAGITLSCDRRLRAVRPIRTAPYPGYPTDAQAILMAALLRSEGTTVFEENIFENRYRHVEELLRLGADIRTYGRVAVVTGTERLSAAALEATDLRGGAALAIAALAAKGQSRIGSLHHIDRGYEDITRDLQQLGAAVSRTKT